MRQIGVNAADIVFLNLPDSRVGDHIGDVGRAIARIIRALPKPVVTLTPSPDDAHADHRAVAAAVRRQPGLHWWTYPVWPAGRSLRGARSLPLTGQERLAKRRALQGYRTQCGRIGDDPTGFTMSARQLAAFTRPQEVFAPMGRR